MTSLRPLAESDINAVHGLISCWEVVRYMLIPLSRSTEDTEHFLRDSLDDSPTQAWRSTVRAIVLDGGEVVGLCGVAVLRRSEEGEIWYLVAPDHWGQGIATAAARMLLDLCFGELRLHRVWATCLPANPASARVLERIGMRREGCLVENLNIHGEWRSCSLYAILDREWRRDSM